MTQIDINGSDTSTLHLFRLDLPEEAVERFTIMAGTGEWPLKYALGATKLRPAFVDVVRVPELDPMTLSQYLSEAYAVSKSVLGADIAKIDTETGHVVVLPPQAFDNTSQTLTIAPPLTHIASYGATAPTPRGAVLQSKAAKGAASGGAPTGPGNGVSLLLKLLVLGVGIVILLTLAMVLR